MVALQRKNPMVGRTFWGLLSVVGVLMGNQKATAQSDPWDVDTLVAGALNQPEIQAVFQETVRAKRAEIAQRTMWQNPVLEAGYGHIVGPKESREVEFSVSVEQSFDMSSWRGRLWDTLPHHEAALASEVDHWRVEVTGLVRAAFFAVRYHEERVKIFETWSKRIETGLETMRTRENRGDVSRYDVLRIEAERESIQLNAAQEKILLAAAWAELRLWIPQENIRSIVGPLAPSQTLGGDRKELPALRRLENLSLVAHQETKVWGSPFLRGWTVGAGYRLLDTEQATGHGFLVTLSVPLIFSNVDEPIVEELNAEANAIDHQLIKRPKPAA
ncbi:MAG: TolC family protein [Myxococcales bacterium]|nr:TolC family protein [Myxococcales bacterium]